jgi:GT2 family glycosyltransferase
MPFGGTSAEARAALDSLRAVDVRPGDELIMADNSLEIRTPSDVPASAPQGVPVTVVPVSGERSPAHARNVGAAQASADWILFLDADCRPFPGLLEAYFSHPVSEDVGSLAGEVVGSSDGQTLAARYGAARNFLSQQDHMRHPFLPRAAAANLLVRRSAFAAVGGFHEGVRAAEDTDFSWRLQQAGWRLELRREARVEHRYRTSVAQLRRQWRSYAAGRAWLSRRYEGFAPEPAVVRGLGRARRRLRGTVREPERRRRLAGGSKGRFRGNSLSRPWRENAPFLALDAVLAFEELAGFALSNRPGQARSDGGAEVILVADEFPRQGDPLVELAATLGRARIEALVRPKAPDVEAGRKLTIHYLEDEGAAMRAGAALAIAAAHPLRVVRDLIARASGEPSTWSLAPAARRLQRDRSARVQALGGTSAQARARRLARLAARATG